MGLCEFKRVYLKLFLPERRIEREKERKRSTDNNVKISLMFQIFSFDLYGRKCGYLGKTELTD